MMEFKIYNDSYYEKLIFESINEGIDLNRLRSLVEKVKDKASLLNSTIEKFNRGVINKKHLAIIIAITTIFLVAPMLADSDESVKHVTTEVKKEQKLTKAKVKAIVKEIVKPKKKIKNAIDIKTAKTSAETKKFIREKEKLRLKAYDLHDGNITIGWGHAEPKEVSKYKLGDVITKTQAENLFNKDIRRVEHAVRDIFAEWEEKGKHIEITQSMFDCLVSLGLNMGINGMRESLPVFFLKRGDYESAANSILRSRISDEFPGLAERRQHEHKLFKKEMNDES